MGSDRLFRDDEPDCWTDKLPVSGRDSRLHDVMSDQLTPLSSFFRSLGTM
jgi:hypothetical protein